MRLISFDLSLTSTGFAVANDGVIKEHGLILGRGDGVKRLKHNRDRVMDKVDEVQPHLVIMEELAWSMNKSYAKENAGLSFMIRAELDEYGLPFAILSSSSIKKFCCGSGATTIKKERVMKDLLVRFHHNVDSNDEADALVLAYIGMAAVGEWEPTIEPQRQTLATVLKSNPWMKGMSARMIAPVSQPELEPISW